MPPATPFVHQVRVIFGDTDQMGVVYYANYLRYFEAARAELLRRIGSSGRHLAELGVGFPVIEAHCRYRLSARYDDLLDVGLEVQSMSAARVRFRYDVRRDADAIADGFTEHACVGGTGRPCRIPDDLRRRFATMSPPADDPAG